MRKITKFIIVFLISGIFFNGTPSKSIKLDKDEYFEVQEKKVKFLRETYVHFYQNGNFQGGVLAEDTAFEVLGKKIRFKKETSICFYENKNFYTGALLETTSFMVQGKKVKLEKDSYVEFYENGNLMSGFLAESAVLKSYGGKDETFSAGTKIIINENNEVYAYVGGV